MRIAINNSKYCNNNLFHENKRPAPTGSSEVHRGKILKIYHINDLFSLFPNYDFGENYRENEQNDSLQLSY